MIYSNYSKERETLALECAEALGLKPIPEIMYKIGVKKSVLPLSIVNDVPIADKENSLLTMGFVYSYDTSLTFTDIHGHSYIMPNHPKVKKELENSGYCICEDEKNSPSLSGDYLEDSFFLTHLKSKYTLPKDLAQKVMVLEDLTDVKNIDESSSRHSYDVFNPRLYPMMKYTHHDVDIVIENIGLDDLTARKFMAITGYASSCLSSSYIANDIEEFVKYSYELNPILNDKEYFSANGMYNYLSNKSSGKQI